MYAKSVFFIMMLFIYSVGMTQDGVFDMGEGAASLDFVFVGNTDNTSELCGTSAGGWGPDRYCGAVDYEFSMGKYEVTAGQYCEFLNAVAANDTYNLYNPDMWSNARGCKIQRSGMSGEYSYSLAQEMVNIPVNYVSWSDAARFSNWLTNGQPSGAQDLTTTEDGSYCLAGAMSVVELQQVSRKSLQEGCRFYIPSEDEWYKTAYHKNDGLAKQYWDYPTGSNYSPGQDILELTNQGNNANYYTYPYDYPICPESFLTEAGEFEDSTSSYGAFDMGGNVWEWNESILYADYRGLRGGAFNNDSISLHAANRSYNLYPTAEDNNVGFRVVLVPEPASMALLALGGAAVMRRKRNY